MRSFEFFCTVMSNEPFFVGLWNAIERFRDKMSISPKYTAAGCHFLYSHSSTVATECAIILNALARQEDHLNLITSAESVAVAMHRFLSSTYGLKKKGFVLSERSIFCRNCPKFRENFVHFAPFHSHRMKLLAALLLFFRCRSANDLVIFIRIFSFAFFFLPFSISLDTWARQQDRAQSVEIRPNHIILYGTNSA